MPDKAMNSLCVRVLLDRPAHPGSARVSAAQARTRVGLVWQAGQAVRTVATPAPTSVTVSATSALVSASQNRDHLTMKGVKLMGKRRLGGLAALGAMMLAAAIAAAGFASGTASAAAAKPGTIAASRATSTAAHEAALIAASYTPSTRTLREGMTGADVKALQSRLAALKYYPGPIDGAFGSDTLEAVWAFQEVQRLTVNGIVGTATKYALV